MIILVTGTPGTGKTEVSRALAVELGCSVLESSSFLLAAGAARRDPSRDTFVVDWESALEAVRRRVGGVGGDECIVVDTVTPTLWLEAAEDEVAFIALLRCHPAELLRRLEGRGWRRGKVVENVLAEAFGSIAEELEPWWHSTFEADTTGSRAESVASRILGLVEEWRPGVRIDWMQVEDAARLVAMLASSFDLDEYRVGL